ncbi:MAG: hypothetical protein C3F15_03615 [Holophagae bacterium]|nr:MAG: hypothetical protein C3F15_03615 [Holophagae bacterium]
MTLARQRSCRRWAAVAVAAALAAGAQRSSPATGPAQPEPQRVVAVGDVHGDIDAFASILREAGLIDAAGEWAGGGATLIQLGDILDRGPRPRAVFDLLIRLEAEAQRAGGRVIVLLGNHEAMNLLGIVRDVNRDAWAEFVDDGSELRRAEALAAFERLWRRRMADVGGDAALTDDAAEQWLALHPLGFVEYSAAFGPSGRYGAWLRQRPAAVILADTLFIHGGYGPALAGVGVEEINHRTGLEIATFDETRAWMVAQDLALPWSSAIELVAEAQRELDWVAAQAPGTVPAERLGRVSRLQLSWDRWYLMAEDGPIWFRGLATWNEVEHGTEVAKLLDDLGVARQVVGHWPHPDGRIRSRFAGRVLLIDTGMLASVYGGRASALEIAGGTVTAIYPGERQTLNAGVQAAADATVGTPGQ